MTSKRASKQQLKDLLPYGMLATKPWLLAQGLGVHALDNAVKSKVLLPLATGVYAQYTQKISWQGVVASLQKILTTGSNEAPPVHVGGLSALELSGLSQYLSLSSGQTVNLYSHHKLPSWLVRLQLSAKFEGHSTKVLWPEQLMQHRKYLKQHVWGEGLPPVAFSCPEKAVLEVLAGVPNSISFEHADELMQGLVNLSPKKLDVLLEACKSIKVKRLFFWLAQRHSYPWLKKLDQDKYNLGTGKRLIAKGGKLDKDFLITVPKGM